MAARTWRPCVVEDFYEEIRRTIDELQVIGEPATAFT